MGGTVGAGGPSCSASLSGRSTILSKASAGGILFAQLYCLLGRSASISSVQQRGVRAACCI
eukprot:scaffold122938_cov17-Prasinocladus_malaysianus.AAC.1